MAWIWPLLAAPFIGSFLGVLIQRLPRREPVVFARSRCNVCSTPIAWYDLVPLLSYTALQGHCRRCKEGIAAFHWQIEVAAVLVPASALSAGLEGAALWAACGAGWTLLALAWIDWNWMRLPDLLTLPLIVAGLCATWWLEPALLTDHSFAAILGWTAFRALALSYRWLRGREGIGAGDAKLLSALGAWVGLAGLPSTLLWAALGGLLWALVWWFTVLRPRGATLVASTAVPFGPFLALAGWIVLLDSW